MSDVCEDRGHDWLTLEDHMLCARCDLTTGLPVVHEPEPVTQHADASEVSGPVDVPAVIADIRKLLRGGTK